MSHGGGKLRSAKAAATVQDAACVGGLHPPYGHAAPSFRFTLPEPNAIFTCPRPVTCANKRAVPTPPPTPAESFATLLTWLTKAVVAMMGGERLPLQLIGMIIDRIRRSKQLFACIAARVAAGRYRPRRGGAVPRPGQKPPPPNKLPQQFGWLLKLVPEAVQYRGQLENLLRDPEMAALLEAAPVPMGRALRPLCRMLGLPPPPILSPSPRPRPPTPRALARETDGGEADRPAAKRKRTKKPPRVRYVFGLRYPPPFPDPA
jgi:hypothetical protein